MIQLGLIHGMVSGACELDREQGCPWVLPEGIRMPLPFRSALRPLAAISGLVCLLAAGANAGPAAPHYAITNLTLGGTDSVGSSINNAGQVVGSAARPDGSANAFAVTRGVYPASCRASAHPATPPL